MLESIKAQGKPNTCQKKEINNTEKLKKRKSRADETFAQTEERRKKNRECQQRRTALFENSGIRIFQSRWGKFREVQIGVTNTAHIEDSGPTSQIYGTPHTLFTPGFMAEMDVIQAHHSLNGITTPFGPINLQQFSGLVRCFSASNQRRSLLIRAPPHGASQTF